MMSVRVLQTYSELNRSSYLRVTSCILTFKRFVNKVSSPDEFSISPFFTYSWFIDTILFDDFAHSKTKKLFLSTFKKLQLSKE